ncbi:MAG: phytanoyl-CoA dioxygenase family protein [Phycisphaeraceae bacterium]
MTDRQPTVTLTAEQITDFQEQGYLAIDRITSDAEVAHLREVYDRIFAERAGREEGNQFDLAGTDEDGKEAHLPQILNPAKYAPELLETELLANAQAIAQQLLGPDARAGFAHAIFKPARHGAPTPWHQDAAYWNPNFIHRSISVWVPLQEATLENGCMHFVPRSHEMEIVRHQSINNDPRVHGLELHPDEMHHADNAVACPLPPGGATFHGGYMLHYTPPNRSDIPRRALILSLAAAGQPRKTSISFPWMDEKQTARDQRAKAAQQ